MPKQKTFAKRPFDREYKCPTKFEKVRSRPMLFELIPRVPAAFVVLFSTNPFAPAAYAAEGVPDRLRSIQFEYRTDIPVTDSQAHKLEVWIPLPAKTDGSGSKRFRSIPVTTRDRDAGHLWKSAPPHRGQFSATEHALRNHPFSRNASRAGRRCHSRDARPCRTLRWLLCPLFT